MNSNVEHVDIPLLIGSGTHEVYMPDQDPEAMDAEPPSYTIAHDLKKKHLIYEIWHQQSNK